MSSSSTTGRRCSRSCSQLAMKHGLRSSRQAISQHLEVLEDAGLVSPDGRAGTSSITCTPRHCGRSSSGGPQTGRGAAAVRINLTSVFVDDQDKALRFYTEVLGFQKKTEVPVGEYRWLTVVSPEAPEGVHAGARAARASHNRSLG
jgi:hypothetical protein